MLTSKMSTKQFEQAKIDWEKYSEYFIEKESEVRRWEATKDPYPIEKIKTFEEMFGYSIEIPMSEGKLKKQSDILEKAKTDKMFMINSIRKSVDIFHKANPDFTIGDIKIKFNCSVWSGEKLIQETIVKTKISIKL